MRFSRKAFRSKKLFTFSKYIWRIETRKYAFEGEAQIKGQNRWKDVKRADLVTLLIRCWWWAANEPRKVSWTIREVKVELCKLSSSNNVKLELSFPVKASELQHVSCRPSEKLLCLCDCLPELAFSYFKFFITCSSLPLEKLGLGHGTLIIKTESLLQAADNVVSICEHVCEPAVCFACPPTDF